MTKILIDLKPALDGYAGIPQEARLLFRGLQTLEGCEIEGLIQHGGQTVRAGISQKKRSLSKPKKVNKLSRVVVSITDKKQHFALLATKVLKESLSRHLLRMRAIVRFPIIPSLFDAELFKDFIWRSFFSKTLEIKDKPTVTTSKYQILSPSRQQLQRVALGLKRFTSTPPHVHINTKGLDIFLAQNPFPARVSKNTQMVVRYHDAVPLLMPHVIENKNFHQASHFYALQDNVRSGAWFPCVSEATRQDLIKIFPEVESRTIVIHNIVSEQYYEDDSPKEQIAKIIPNRIATGKGVKLKSAVKPLQHNIDIFNKAKIILGFDYLLVVSTVEPRKNHLLLLEAWERLKYSSMPDLKLVVVGNIGWDHEAVIDAFRPWAEQGDLFYLNNVPSYELRSLYKHAEATICPSLYEGFDYSGVEAMRCGGIVISSDIPVHREIYQDASLYFSPYNAEDAAETIKKTLANTSQAASTRKKLQENSKNVSKLYLEENILPKWGYFLQELSKKE